MVMAAFLRSCIVYWEPIDQSKYDQVTEDTPHNIYLTVTPTSDFSQKATVTRQLTDFTNNGKSFMGVKITKISDNCFMISGNM